MAANARSSNSGVRNLRAMFESGGSADDSTSPPPRGRSPARESANNGPTRPLSKVRTSFVAVERSGQFGPQLGLKKANGDNIVEVKPEANGGAAEKPKGSGVDMAAVGRNGMKGKSKTNDPKNSVSPAEEPKAEPLLVATGSDNTASGGQTKNGVDAAEGAASALSAAEIPLPDTPKAGEKKKTNVLVKGQTAAGAKPNVKGKEKVAPAPAKITGPTKAKETATAKPKAGAARPAPPPITVSKDTSSSKPLSKATAPKIDPKTTKTPKTPTSPNKPSNPTATITKPRAPAVTASDSIKAPTKKPSRASMAPSATIASSATPKPRLPTAAFTAPVSKQTMPSPPKAKVEPKSPTRPARLPTSITAPTASSAAKKSTSPSRPASQASVNVGRQPSASQKANKLSPARPTTTASVRRQPSRPSLPERPRSRNAAVGAKAPSTVAPDEGFLARMMRPTASSASKTHEKAHDKVPEKTEDKAYSKHEKHEKGDGKAAKAVKKVVKSPRKSGGADIVASEEKHAEPEHTVEGSVKETEQLDHHDVIAKEEEKIEEVESVKPMAYEPEVEETKAEEVEMEVPEIEESKIEETKTEELLDVVKEDQVEDAHASEASVPQVAPLVTAE